MSGRIPLFVELCAGTAAVSLRLEHGRGSKPPVSRMGAKTGYATAILNVLGLRTGQGAERYLWCEPDPGARLLLAALADPELAAAAAAILRSWEGQDEHELWKELRASPFPENAAGVAGAVFVQGRTFFDGGFKRRTAATHQVQRARFLPQEVRERIGAHIRERRIAAGLSQADVDRALGLRTACSWWEGRKAGTRPPSPEIWERLKPLLNLDPSFDDVINSKTERKRKLASKGWAVGMPGAVQFADRLTAAAVARAHLLGSWSYRKGEPASGFDRVGVGGRPRTATDNGSKPRTVYDEARLLEGRAPCRARIEVDAREVEPVAGAVVFVDPPYVGTTGYANDLPRSEVVDLVLRWQAAGALVAVSEQEPIAELVSRGWHSVEITNERVGQRRTFSRQQREWLTVSEAPRWRPARQASLFNG